MLSLLSEIEKGTKSALMKKRIISYIMSNDNVTNTELAKVLNLSVPTVSKFIEELSAAGIVRERGKLATNGGRHPLLYGLNPESCYFAGVDMKNGAVSVGLIDFCGDMVGKQTDIPYDCKDTPEGLDRLCDIVKSFIASSGVNKDLIINLNLNISGRVNPQSGYSYSRFNFGERPLSDVLTEKTGVHCCIENDTRAMALGEYMCGNCRGERNVIFVNVGWGLGIGLIIDRKIYTGKSGFAGEFGHMVACDNEVMCHCGKKGCLETEASGSALHRKLIARLEAGENSVLAERFKEVGDVSLSEIMDAVAREDLLCIELVEEVGQTLGRWLAGLINIFNPEKVVIGGALSSTGDYMLQPIRSWVKRYSLNLVNEDTKIVLSKLGDQAGLIGACLIARNRAFEDVTE
ncbi:MAG TPA: ROK family transcriptional regulator [Candidatus Limisoma intestinavium]|uniref:ROK family transcriptional regulator n=1 Tax=Candidatus Limisoma intestinavium TaxID=2840856 RepID=A0A9D1IM29_9BACT|nr:ROK family transcriptional regulator [Candidatus Limisoma intestinavium]